MTKGAKKRISCLIRSWTAKAHTGPRYMNASRYVAFGKDAALYFYQQQYFNSAQQADFKPGAKFQSSQQWLNIQGSADWSLAGRRVLGPPH